jgi:YD repeat-containing protein
MKTRFTLLFVSLASLLTLFTACRKEMDVPNKDEVAGTPLPGQPTYCRIESIWENPHAADQRYFLVLYNEYENPTAVTIPFPSTGHPYRTFKYDGWHRLKEYLGEYGNGNFEFWHFYGFDNNGRIGVDTNYVLGTLSDKPRNYFDRIISQIQYDSEGRIIRVSSTNMSGAHTETTYTYDARGNLVYPGVTYDDKINLNRTNDIWMFLNRDYSMNNPFFADAYNSAGYPTVINTNSPSPSMLWLSEVDLHHSQIGYGCRQSHW